MIIDRIENAPHYFGLGPQWKTALTAVMEYDPAKFEKGKKTELENGVRFLQFEPTTKDRSEVIFEAHRKYADLHCVLEGTQRMWIGDTEQMEFILKENLQYAFPDFAPYLGKCQFHDCAHLKEPGCAVRNALEEGLLEPTRYDSYLRLYEKASQIKEWELK